MNYDINTLISLFSAIISLASFFGLFYKMKYQLEQLEKKQDKHNSVIERMQTIEIAINTLDIRQKNILAEIEELKGEKNGREINTRAVEGS